MITIVILAYLARMWRTYLAITVFVSIWVVIGILLLHNVTL